MTDQDAIRRIGDLVEEGNRVTLALPQMRAELAELVFWARDGLGRGMPIETMFPDAAHNIGAQPASRVVLEMDAATEAAKIGSWYRASSLLAVVSTEYDGPEAWIAAGRLGVALMLEAAAVGVAHCISAAPVEVPFLTPRLRAELPTDCRPQLLLRLGRPVSQPSAKTERTPLRELFAS